MRNFLKNLGLVPHFFKRKGAGFTLIEMLIATAISAVILTVAFGTIGNVYFSQKRIRGSHDFYAESRFLMERVVQIARNNTIDYDRFFEEVGPDKNDCSAFHKDQTIKQTSVTNNRNGRISQGYETIFYWDTNDDDIRDRNLGGADLDGNPDDCAQAFYEKNGEIVNTDGKEILYLINGTRTLRAAIKEESGQIMVQRQLGADTDDDGKADLWHFKSRFSSNEICEIEEPGNSEPLHEILGDSSDKELCARAHDWTAISPKAIRVTGFTFKPSPDRDPFLNFRVDSAQIHPHVFLLIKTKLSNPERFGFEITEEPQISLQTAASSRIFGNTRK